MTKGNGKDTEDIGTINFDEPQDKKVIAVNIVQFLREVAAALDYISRHQEAHCRQIGILKAEVDALKKGLSAKAEPVNFGETHV